MIGSPYPGIPAEQLVMTYDQWKTESRIVELTAALEEALEYFKERYDIRDGAEGEQRPNKEMRLGQMIDETLHGGKP